MEGFLELEFMIQSAKTRRRSAADIFFTLLGQKHVPLTVLEYFRQQCNKAHLDFEHLMGDGSKEECLPSCKAMRAAQRANNPEYWVYLGDLSRGTPTRKLEAPSEQQIDHYYVQGSPIFKKCSRF